MYDTQVIVGNELSPDDLLYLACLTNDSAGAASFKQLKQDCITHHNEQLYTDYVDQLTHPRNTKGVSSMVSENLLRLYGTNSKEIEEKTKAIYEPQLEANDNRIAMLEQLLQDNNISFD